MPAVWVRRDEAERGGLPARCARSGERCITRYRRRVSDLPAAVEWASWTDLWPRHHDRPADHVVLPVLPRQQRLHDLLRHSRDGSAGVLGIALVALLLLDGLPADVARIVGLAALVAHLLAALLGWALTVEVREDTTGRWIRLSGVHRDFVAATEAVTSRPTATPVLPEVAVRTPPPVAGGGPDGSTPATGG